MDFFSAKSAAAPAVILVAVMAMAPARAGPAEQPPIDFFFDLAGENLAEAGIDPGDGTPLRSGIEIGGIPLQVGVDDGATDLGWHMVAGARGRYRLDLTDGLAVIAKGSATRTTFFDGAVPGRAAAAGSTDFRFAAGGWTLGLKPGFEVTRWESGLLREDGSVEARIARGIIGGLSLATSARYRWRLATGPGALGSEAAAGRFGLTWRLPEEGRMELAYSARREAWRAAGSSACRDDAVALSTGPSVALALPLDSVLDLNASYAFTETVGTNADAAAGMVAAGTQDLHQLGVALTWDVGGALADLQLSAAYRYERQSLDGQDEDRHAATLNLAVGF
jgi:hypothetical protein